MDGDHRSLMVAGGMLLAAVLLQSAFFPTFTLFGARPDLVTVLAVLFGLYGGPRTGAVLGGVGGLLVDLLAGRLVGLGLLSRGVVGWVSGLLGRRIFSENWLVPVVAVLLGTILEQGLYMAGASVYGLAAPWQEGFLLSALATGWYGALLAVPLVPAVLALIRRMGPILDEGRRLRPEE